jgi:hypothetical protein
MTRTIAIDWSGAKVGAAKKIWIAEARDEQLLMLESGRDRDQVAAWLIDEMHRGEPLVVGLDFAFSFPRWFLDEHAIDHPAEMWSRMHHGLAERWLASPTSPFWGRRGSKCTLPAARRRRRTEADSSAKSVFQIGGAGAVGTGSLRGMAVLHVLRQAGFRIWPFDDQAPGTSTALEIYPRRWSIGVVKSRLEQREKFLEMRQFAKLKATMLARACSTDDAFDAAISALAMDAAGEALTNLPAIVDPVLRREGLIWPGALE